MATLISKNEEMAYSLHLWDCSCFTLEDGGVLIVSSKEDLKRCESWLHENGVSSIYLNPAYAKEDFSEFYVKTCGDGETVIAIELYN